MPLNLEEYGSLETYNSLSSIPSVIYIIIEGRKILGMLCGRDSRGQEKEERRGGRDLLML